VSSSLQAIRIALGEMLPDVVNVVLPVDGKGDVYAEELALVGNVADKRRTEFIAGRLAAKQALAELGVNDFPLLKGGKGEPLWPTGVVGSISHTQDICIASVSNADDLLGLGVDIEVQRVLKADIQRVICREEELSLHWHADTQLAKLILFSAKESVYKALYPTQQRFIGFKEVRVEFDDELGFVATLVDEKVVCRGAYRVVGGFVVSVSTFKLLG